MPQSPLGTRAQLPTFAHVALLALCLFALWLRAPRIGEGLPFFYREDEAHHFNRLAEMVKSGSLDPVYFHKPSLHFYLRMPVFGASFFWNVKKGAIRSIQEVNTRDEYGVGDYSFSASHPGIVKWSRAATVALGLALIPLSFFIAFRLSSSVAAAFLASAAVAVSPPLIEEGAVIGVDILMATMCTLSVLLALRLYERFSLSGLWICALTCGLAISSKYNAAPIALVPLATCLLAKKHSWPVLTAALGGPVLGFLAATPYLLVHIPLFLDQVAYEVWHYGVAGHVGHMTEPGWPQFLFYLRWLNFEALGPAYTALGLLGVVFLWNAKQPHKAVVFLLFPLLFGALMISQKTNFTRNMLVIIPFISVIAGVAFVRSLEALRLEGKGRLVALAALVLLGLGYPLRESLLGRAEALSFVDNRSIIGTDLMEALSSQRPGEKEQVALSGQLQFPIGMFRSGSFARFDQTRKSLLALYSRGFSKIVAAPAWGISSQDSSLFQSTQTLPGEKEQQRIVQNPSIQVFTTTPSPELTGALTGLSKSDPELQIDVQLAPASDSVKACSVAGGLSPASATETYCWTQGRVVFLKFLDLERALKASADSSKITLYFDAMTPWAENPIRFFVGDWSQSLSSAAGAWTSFSVQPPLSAIKSAGGLFVEVQKVKSPKLQGLSADDRNLGVALRNIRLNGQ
jgi:hypothetical protein